MAHTLVSTSNIPRLTSTTPINYMAIYVYLRELDHDQIGGQINGKTARRLINTFTQCWKVLIRKNLYIHQ